MPKRKKKGETIVETSASPTESRYSRRSRKKVNYNENIAKNEEKENEDSDFENETIQRKNGYIKDSEDDYGSESSDDDKPLKKTKSAPTHRKKSILKNINSTENSRSFNDQDSYKQITGFVARPNLSEDESSESESDGEIPLKKNKNVLEESTCSATMSRKNESFQKSAPVVKIDISEVDKLQFGRNYKIKKDKSNESLAEVPNKVLERSNEIDTSDTDVAPQKEKTAKNKQERKDIENKRKRNLSNKESEVPISKRSKQQVESRETVRVSENKTDNKRTRSMKGETKEKETLKEAGKKNVNLKKLKLSRSAQKNKKANEEDTRRERLKPEDVQGNSEESEDNWEDVDEAKIKTSPKKFRQNKEVEKKVEVKDVEISVGVKSIHKKKKSHAEKMFIWVRQMMGRIQRERQIALHKSHLLCLLAKSLQENELCCNKEIQGVCLSLVTKEFLIVSADRWDVSHLRRFLTWFQVNDIMSSVDMFTGGFCQELQQKFQYLTKVHVFVVILRALGFLARLVCSFQPVTAKVRSKDVSEANSPTEETGKKSKKLSKSQEIKEQATPTTTTNEETESPYFKDKERPTEKLKKLKTKNEHSKTTPNSNSKISKNNNSKNNSKSNQKTPGDSSSKYSHRKRSSVNYKDPGTENESEENGSDDDFDIKDEKKKMKTPSSKKVKRSSSVESKNENTRKRISSMSKGGTGLGSNTWLEVYLKTMKKWICVELLSDSINEPATCESLATRPLQYVIGIDNKQKVKDVTCRYAEKWLGVNRKLRVDRDWWAETLQPYAPRNDTLNKSEDAQLKQELLKQDFPTTISEFKNHPLYALKRHLLKFEAIYPESAVPLGYIRGEEIYSRDCVHELHTRETWMKQARVVKAGEIPYKIVKGRPKRSTPVMERDNIKVNTFGLWQTEIYVPPPVVNGKVPKNEYGNVELFQPGMLPEGAVHLPMANMQKIARKLNIDYAPAMMGWDFHGGFSHPVIEGVVVAKEFEDKLLDAWRRDEEEQERKEQEKREKRIYENWKTLIKGVLIRHKLQNKYKFEDEKPQQAKQKVTKKVAIGNKKTTKHQKGENSKSSKVKDEYSDLSVSWPMNRMGGTSAIADEGHVHIFPESNYIKDKESGVKMKICSCGLKLPLDSEEKL